MVELWGYILSYEQFIPNFYPQSNLTYNSMSKGQILSYAHLILHSCDNLNDSSPVSTLSRGWSGGNLTPVLLPHHLSRGVGLGVWLAGSSIVLCPC